MSEAAVSRALSRNVSLVTSSWDFEGLLGVNCVAKVKKTTKEKAEKETKAKEVGGEKVKVEKKGKKEKGKEETPESKPKRFGKLKATKKEKSSK